LPNCSAPKSSVQLIYEVWANPVPGHVLIDGDQIAFVDKRRCDQIDGGESAALCVGFVENLVNGSGVKR
jgi:hypothetical protein